MTFTFNDEYLLKSMMSLVRDESNRIISLGLTTQDGLKKFIEPKLHDVIKQANGDRSVVLKVLTDLHNSLNAIRLPGDFEKVSTPIGHQLYAEMDIEIPTETERVILEDHFAPESDNADKDIETEKIKAICTFLSNTAYKLGKNGNHEAAYLVERTVHKIVSHIAK